MNREDLGGTGISLLQGSCCQLLEVTDENHDKLKMPSLLAGIPEVIRFTAV
jgi:hypothetical protein